MEAVLLMGIEASGKTTFYQQRFFATHVRISLDLLRTRERARYILPSRAAGFRVIGYFFELYRVWISRPGEFSLDALDPAARAIDVAPRLP